MSINLKVQVTDLDKKALKDIPVNILNETGVYDASRLTDKDGYASVDNFSDRDDKWRFTVNLDQRLNVKTNVDYDNYTSELIAVTSNFVIIRLRKRNFKVTLSLTP
jgi:hypothetical protein